MPEWALAFLPRRVREHLTPLAQPDRLDRLPGDPAVLATSHRVATLEDDRRRLETLAGECLDRPITESEHALARLEAVLADLRPYGERLAALHLRDEAERRYGLPLPRWRELRRRYHEQARAIIDLPLEDINQRRAATAARRSS